MANFGGGLYLQLEQHDKTIGLLENGLLIARRWRRQGGSGASVLQPGALPPSDWTDFLTKYLTRAQQMGDATQEALGSAEHGCILDARSLSTTLAVAAADLGGDTRIQKVEEPHTYTQANRQTDRQTDRSMVTTHKFLYRQPEQKQDAH